jgi:hypothetical protein
MSFVINMPVSTATGRQRKKKEICETELPAAAAFVLAASQTKTTGPCHR